MTGGSLRRKASPSGKRSLGMALARYASRNTSPVRNSTTGQNVIEKGKISNGAKNGFAFDKISKTIVQRAPGGPADLLEAV